MPVLAGELRDPFDCDEQVVKALVTVGAFVALADGHLDAIERDEAVGYIDRQQLGRPSHDGALLIFSTHKHAISREETLAI
jgi:tellurite resistance protein